MYMLISVSTDGRRPTRWTSDAAYESSHLVAGSTIHLVNTA